MHFWQAYPDEEGINELKNIVNRYFKVYELNYEDGVISFHVDMEDSEKIIERKFNLMREELKRKNFIPLLRHIKGEYIIFLVYRKERKGKPLWVNISLLILTVITTTLSGSILFLTSSNLWDMFRPENIFNGLIFFSIPLMAILGIHEMGHYFAAKKHGVASSLPFFIPIPPNPFLPLGTMGAVISMREPIPDRKSLLDIGISGPIAGFIVSIPVLIIGLAMSQVVNISTIPENTPVLGDNLMMLILSSLMFHLDKAHTIMLHPTAFAGWVGMLVTAINLLPAGQLDGGHVARAVLKEKHRYASMAAIAGLAALSFFGNGGWLFMLLIIVFFIGPEHPPALNELTSLDMKRKLLAIAGLIIFILCFTPQPIS
ncbi:MAG: site-2 protease family protein [Thermoplasmata archaeon]|nr:site-2 protease family protein [Thermoplasmata archaeon]